MTREEPEERRDDPDSQLAFVLLRYLLG